jgi:predicted regulator of Ras-like GTPase activity (Roadblock/LC7/MglB family)
MASVPLADARRMVADRLAAGDVDGALDLGRQLADRFPRDRRVSLLLGRAYLAQGSMSDARPELERAAAAFPDEREVHEALAACGSDTSRVVLAELPPLPAANGSRPAISAPALGHLYLRQYLLPHCTAQLGPVWRGDPARLDVGLALAEAHWRLGENDAAVEICRSLLRAAPECLKANLIVAQVLGRAQAPEHIVAAEAVDPENLVAEDLYQWLTARDPALAPLRSREVRVDLPGLPEPAAPGPIAEQAPEPTAAEALAAGPAAPESMAEQELAGDLRPPEPIGEEQARETAGPEPAAQEAPASEPYPEERYSPPEVPRLEEPSRVGEVLSNLERPSDPIEEPAPFWEGPPAGEPSASAADVEDHGQAAEAPPDPAEPQPWFVADASPAPTADLAGSLGLPAAEAEDAQPAAEPPGDEAAPSAEAPPAWQPAAAEVLPDAASAPPGREPAELAEASGSSAEATAPSSAGPASWGGVEPPAAGWVEQRQPLADMPAEAGRGEPASETFAGTEHEQESSSADKEEQAQPAAGEPERVMAFTADDTPAEGAEGAEAPSGEERAETTAGFSESEPAPAEAVAAFTAEPAAAAAPADVAATAPEPALLPVESAAERAGLRQVRWLEVSPRGQIAAGSAPATVNQASIADWHDVCSRLGQRSGLGGVRASSIETARGAVQLLHDGDAITVALAPVGANLGLVRSRLRAQHGHHTSEEHNSN